MAHGPGYGPGYAVCVRESAVAVWAAEVAVWAAAVAAASGVFVEVGWGVAVGTGVLVGVLVGVRVLVGVLVLVGVDVNVGKRKPVREGKRVEEGRIGRGVRVASAVGEEYPGSTRKVGVRVGMKTPGIGVGGGKGFNAEVGSVNIAPKRKINATAASRIKIERTSQRFNRMFVPFLAAPAEYPFPVASIYEIYKPSRKVRCKAQARGQFDRFYKNCWEIVNQRWRGRPF
jgi:hypothetical protein